MFEARNFYVGKVPPLTSDYWKPIVMELRDELQYYDEASAELRTIKWPMCARAYLCRRDLPELESMEFLDSSPYGETDIFDGVNFMTDATMNAHMPRDQSYIDLLAYDQEDQASLNDVRDLLMSLFRKADLRSQYAKHVKQTYIYGTSALWWQWRKRIAWKKFGPAETMRRLQDAGTEVNPETFQADYKGKNIKFPVTTFNGPVVRPIDIFDFWMEPTADLSCDGDYGIITRFYLTMAELEGAVDADGKPKYENLKDLVPKTLDEIYSKVPERLEIIKDLGMNPLANGKQSMALVPIYLFHKPVRTFDADKGNSYVDTFFYLAETNDQSQYRLIRVEDNSNISGSRGIYVDTYIDMPGSAYGIGAVEKSVNSWEYKNVVAALGLNAQVSAVFPAYSIIAGVVPNDGAVKFSPGSLTVINNKPQVGLNYIAPMPVPQNGVQVGQQVEQWHGQKILSQMQAYGAIKQDPTKSIKHSKTATEINTESTSGSVVRDNFLEKMCLRSLEPLIQDIYDNARESLDDPIMHFDRTTDEKTSLGQVTPDQLNKERRVIATGFHGMVNKQQEIEQLQQALQIMTTGNALEQLPNLKPVLQDLVFKLLGRLGVRNLEEYKASAIQILMQDPQVQAQIQQFVQEQAAQMVSGAPPQPGMPSEGGMDGQPGAGQPPAPPMAPAGQPAG